MVGPAVIWVCLARTLRGSARMSDWEKETSYLYSFILHWKICCEAGFPRKISGTRPNKHVSALQDFSVPLPESSRVCAAAAAAKSLQSCPILCDPIDSSPPGSPVPEIPQARTLEWVAIAFSNAWKWKVKVKSLSHVRLFETPFDCSPPGSSTHGIFQARVLEWGAIAFMYVKVI